MLHGEILDIAVDELSLTKANLYKSIVASCGTSVLENDNDQNLVAISRNHVDQALKAIRQARRCDYLPKALLTQAMACGISDFGIPNREEALRASHSALDEAEQIARRGPMPLYLAEIHLTRARLFRDRQELTEARRLIDEIGFGRLREQLEDAEAAAETWQS